ncbi:hypothetical protein FKW77_002850 [Venturia effusa]|uniref:non-specific serine/threonine protein kinase n=1 Tax=Venturia effusa TaxID=50376 RepID=A0A517LAK7_9PEZI|nr:hypothetical protein FKW77_002850 [Venturia effusa]
MPNGLPGPLRLTTFFLLALAAAQQQQSRKDGSRSSPPENAALPQLTKTDPLQRQNVDSPTYKSGRYTSSISDDERAVATLAPAGLRPAVRAPPASRSAAGSSAGIAQPLQARRLQDWEVENFVLMATVDGSIYARDRNTGKELWKFHSEDPMVQTKYNRDPASDHDGEDTNDDFMWIVEPSDGGILYTIIPGLNTGIQKLPMTVRELADHSPYTTEESPFVFNAEKRTKLFTLNATNGDALKYFGVGGGGVMNQQNCRKVSGLELDEDEDECEPTPTLQLGRTEYTVNIQDIKTQKDVCTIKYFEWTPNRRDGDLADKYSSTMDNKYIYSRRDGGVFALEYQDADTTNPLPLYTKDFRTSPVVRVFDVVKPQGTDSRDTSLVILPQPIAPSYNRERAQNVFINCTETGSWYAMSEMRYPSITDGAPEAKCYQLKRLLDDGPVDDKTFLSELSSIKASELVGVHALSDTREPAKNNVPTLDAPGLLPDREVPKPILQVPNRPPIQQMIGSMDSTFTSRSRLVSRLRTIDPLTLFILCVLGILSWQQFKTGKGNSRPLQAIEITARSPATPPAPTTEPAVAMEPEQSLPLTPESEAPVKRTVHFAPTEEKSAAAVVNGTTPNVLTPVPTPGHLEPVVEEPTTLETPKKKKAHRGSRGGKSKRRKAPGEDEMDDNITRIMNTVAPRRQPMQPDQEPIIDGAVNDVSDARHIGSITVNNEKALGQGSGGTVVYEGTFEGRKVAVKQMLLHYYDLASQEITLLSQADHHENVIRYYRHEKDQHFLYIAVECCQASLYDLYKDGDYRPMLQEQQVKLVDDVSAHMRDALYQLADGLHHLHTLRIIHRDIKPQNILVAFPKKTDRYSPRLVISDFGLCRTLPENVSTLAGTAGNAGTIGWKAPELIGVPKLGEGRNSSTMNDSSSSNEPGAQGVKRAVDIFSLGCVYFYMLTNGFHPFETEDSLGHYDREKNIKMNKPNFSMLSKWDRVAEEPLRLIQWMLQHDPKDRPTALQVMNHPFFWDTQKRLDFLCECSDHWEEQPRNPPSQQLMTLEDIGVEVHKGDFLRCLDASFIATLGKQRKYTGDRMLDLLRALRNKKNHYADMDEAVKKRVGPLPDGYLKYWTDRFPNLLMACHDAVKACGLEDSDRFKRYWSDARFR